mgnify:CR=1 FL=1
MKGKRLILNIFTVITLILIIYFITRQIPFGESLLQNILYLIVRLIISVVVSIFILWITYKKTKIYIQAKEWILSHSISLR